MILVSQYREAVKLGRMKPFDVPALLCDVTAGTLLGDPSTRTVLGRPAPSLQADIFASRSATLVELKKTERNGYGKFVVVGRGSSADVALKHHSISKAHAWFEEKDGGWVLHDSRSRNGTFVDGKRVSPSGSMRVHSSARLTFGTLQAFFLEPHDLAVLMA